MSYSSELTRLAWLSEQSLGRLVDEQVQENERTGALDALEAGFQEASADGVLDARELESLSSLSRAAGTSAVTERLEALRSREGSADGVELEAAKNLLEKSLASARIENEAGSSQRQLLLQLGMSEMRALYESASGASRMEHQSYMIVIGNLKA